MPADKFWSGRFSRRGSEASTRDPTRRNSVTNDPASPPPQLQQSPDFLERLHRVFSGSTQSSGPPSPNASTSFSIIGHRGKHPSFSGSCVSPEGSASLRDSFDSHQAEEGDARTHSRRLGRKAKRELALGPTVRPKHEDQLQKESTSKLTNFWGSAGVIDRGLESPEPLLPDLISPYTLGPPVLPELTSGTFKVSLASIPETASSVSRSTSGKSKMDASRLAPGSFDGPNKEMQIKDAQDMYQTVVRNAERSNSNIPPYDFIELIGKGSFGRVYKCKEQSTGDIVAVKIINIDDVDFQENVLEKDNTIDSFRKEVGILQQLKDAKAKNVNLIHDAFDLHNQLWIVCDYCTGGSVRTLMRANPTPGKGLEEHFIIPIARELALAMKSVHEIGVIHRDIKCANVYINEEGEIQLGDFGIVGVMDDGSSKRRTIIGTPHYLPHEMLSSTSHLTNEAYGTELDIWSYGVTVYEMATGRPPNSNVRQEDLVRALQDAPRLEGGDFSQDLRDFVAYCLNSDPKQRPSADDLLRHPFIFNTSRKYPTRSLVRLIDRYAAWEYKGGQRQSLFFAGGAAAPTSGDDNIDNDTEDPDEWNFSLSEDFNAAFGRRYSQMSATQSFSDTFFEAPPGSGLPPIVTKDLSEYDRLQEHFQQVSANRGERSLDRLWNPTAEPYELHTPVEASEPLSDLPLRNMTSAGPTRESLIDLDSAAALDMNVPTFNFEYGDGATLKAKTARRSSQVDEEEEDYEYASAETDEKRATMEWTFPSVSTAKKADLEPKRATMDWTFPSNEPTEPDEPDASMSLPPPGSNGQVPPGFRPNLLRTATEPVGQFNDFMHPAPQLTLATLPSSMSPVRDSMASMIDLDMGLADPADIIRPSTASSATGSTMTDMTSGNPFDLEEDPEQNEIDRDRFSYHKQWQSEGGQLKRRSHKTMPMHSRGSSLTSTDSEMERGVPETPDIFDYEYNRSMSDTMRQQLMLGIPAAETEMPHWPNFGQDSGLDDSPQYPAMHASRLGEHDFPIQQHSTHANGMSTTRSFSRPSRAPSRNRGGTRRELEFPTLIAPHPDALLEEADPQLVMAEMNRLLEDVDESLKITSRALRQHNGVVAQDVSSGTDDSGFDESSTAATGDEDGY